MEFETNLRCFEDLWSEMVGNLEMRDGLEKRVLDFGSEGWEKEVERWKEKVGLVAEQAINGGCRGLSVLESLLLVNIHSGT